MRNAPCPGSPSISPGTLASSGRQTHSSGPAGPAPCTPPLPLTGSRHLPLASPSALTRHTAAPAARCSPSAPRCLRERPLNSPFPLQAGVGVVQVQTSIRICHGWKENNRCVAQGRRTNCARSRQDGWGQGPSGKAHQASGVTGCRAQGRSRTAAPGRQQGPATRRAHGD